MPRLAELAAKALKETRYHFRYSSGWVVRLGDGTEESHRRVQAALDALWRFTHELFAARRSRCSECAAPASRPIWRRCAAAGRARVDEVLQEATLKQPADVAVSRGTASAASTASIWATCWPRCSSCSAPIRGRSGSADAMPLPSSHARARGLAACSPSVPDPEIPVLNVVELGVVRYVRDER